MKNKIIITIVACGVYLGVYSLNNFIAGFIPSYHPGFDSALFGVLFAFSVLFVANKKFGFYTIKTGK